MPIDLPRSGAPADPVSPASFTSSISYPSTDAFERHDSARANENADQDDEEEGSEDSYEEDEESAMIQAEWEESMRQLETVVSIVLIPFLGKWWGRKWAFWGESCCSFITQFGAWRCC